MEILLIGNGFDLEHCLPTSYIHFLGFCERARRIYTFSDGASPNEYTRQNLDDWKMNDCIKEKLSVAFENRNCTRNIHEDKTYSLEVTTFKELDELYTYINNNAWLEYFLACPSYIGDGWIDFET